MADFNSVNMNNAWHRMDELPQTHHNISALATFAEYLGNYRPRKIPGRKLCVRSGVTIVLSAQPIARELSVLMIRRAKREGDPWSGNMGFPGGRAEGDDQSIFHAAVREFGEETGIPARESITPLGRLSELVTRAHEKWVPMIITPFVFMLHELPAWRLSREVDEVVWVPLRFLMNRSNRTTMPYGGRGFRFRIPCYFYEDRRIWGLSLLMLDELMTLFAHVEAGTSVRRRLFTFPRFEK